MSMFLRPSWWCKEKAATLLKNSVALYSLWKITWTNQKGTVLEECSVDGCDQVRTWMRNVMCFRKANNAFQEKKLISTGKHVGGSTMVWVCFSGSGPGWGQAEPSLMEFWILPANSWCLWKEDGLYCIFPVQLGRQRNYFWRLDDHFCKLSKRWSSFRTGKMETPEGLWCFSFRLCSFLNPNPLFLAGIHTDANFGLPHPPRWLPYDRQTSLNWDTSNIFHVFEGIINMKEKIPQL